MCVYKLARGLKLPHQRSRYFFIICLENSTWRFAKHDVERCVGGEVENSAGVGEKRTRQAKVKPHEQT